ncbi:DUF465 domain-containing protein [Amylibacter sp.]|nr:DUF465 domain-containing protein [Amylibacter sp.]MDC1242929.1 DUF465 domain-containing protein [Amylibacter sp.]
MRITSEMSYNEVLKIELIHLQQKHRDLDSAIEALQKVINSDLLSITRLKRNKLALKDKIARIEDKLTPDIIA